MLTAGLHSVISATISPIALLSVIIIMMCCFAPSVIETVEVRIICLFFPLIIPGALTRGIVAFIGKRGILV
jgi:hypothetical protein